MRGRFTVFWSFWVLWVFVLRRRWLRGGGKYPSRRSPCLGFSAGWPGHHDGDREVHREISQGHGWCG